MTEMKCSNLIMSTEHHVDICDLTNNRRPSNKLINFGDEILISFDDIDENLAVYEKFNKKFNIYTMKGVLKTSFAAKFDLSTISFCQGRWIIGADNLGTLYFYDMKFEKFKMNLNSPTNMKESITEMCLSADDKNLYVCHGNGVISAFDMQSKSARTLTWIDKKVSTIKSSPWNINYLSSGSGDGVVSLYNIESEKCLFKCMNHEKKINCLSFSQYNECLMISGGEDKRAILFGSDTQRPQKIFETKNPVTCCSMSDDILFSFGESDGKVSVYDLRKIRDPLHVFKQNGRINCLEFTSKHKRKNDTLDLFNMCDTTNASVMRDTQYNFSNDNSSNSVFSIDEDSQNGLRDYRNNINDSFDLSHYEGPQSSSEDRSNIPENKNRKQVQFQNDFADKIMSLNTTPQVNRSNEISSAHNKSLPQYNNASCGDNTAILRAILDLSAELKTIRTEIVNSENQIKLYMVDQLSITEKNVTDSMTALKQENRDLSNENLFLRQELRKYGYNC